MPIRNLPGVIVNTLDGGLTAAFAPQDDSILIIGTAGQGVVNTPYQVTERALVAKEFGFSGSLERSIEECASNSDNTLALRCGTKPMVLAGVGLDTTVGSTAAGFSITFNDVTSDAGTRYQHPGPERVGLALPRAREVYVAAEQKHLVWWPRGSRVQILSPPTILSLTIKETYATFCASSFSSVFGTFGTTEESLKPKPHCSAHSLRNATSYLILSERSDMLSSAYPIQNFCRPSGHPVRLRRCVFRQHLNAWLPALLLPVNGLINSSCFSAG